MLIERGYRLKVIESAFDRVRRLSREYTLEKVMKVPSDTTTFVITYDPRLTSIPGVIHKHARTLMMDSRMKEAASKIEKGKSHGMDQQKRGKVYGAVVEPVYKTLMEQEGSIKSSNYERM